MRSAPFQSTLRGLRDDRGRHDRRRARARQRASCWPSWPDAFYPEGGGPGVDTGWVETESGRARVTDVFRVGDDQALELQVEEGEIGPGQGPRAQSRATAAGHPAQPHRHPPAARGAPRAAGRARPPGRLVRRPGQAALRLHHGERLSPEELRDVEQMVNGWILDSHGVRAITTTRDEAERLGAMALFGEKYGDVVRMVEVGDGFSRELCGGTHVAMTGEIGLFDVAHETSSASNVRRIEAVTGPVGVDVFRRRTNEIREIARCCACPRSRWSRRSTAAAAAQGRAEASRADDRQLAESVLAAAEEIGGVRVVTRRSRSRTPRRCSSCPTRSSRSWATAVVLGTAVDGRVHLVANFSDAAVGRGLKAGDVVKVAAQITGGGGEGASDDGAGRRPRPREAPRGARRGARGDRAGAAMSRIMALDYGAARCGVALSDPSGTLATPLPVVERLRPKEGARPTGRSDFIQRSGDRWSWDCRSRSRGGRNTGGRDARLRRAPRTTRCRYRSSCTTSD